MSQKTLRQTLETKVDSKLASQVLAASFPAETRPIWSGNQKQQPHLKTTMKIAKLAIAAAAVSLLAASCCPSSAPAPAPAPATSSK
jgi:hypothetical protein